MNLAIEETFLKRYTEMHGVSRVARDFVDYAVRFRVEPLGMDDIPGDASI